MASSYAKLFMRVSAKFFLKKLWQKVLYLHAWAIDKRTALLRYYAHLSRSKLSQAASILFLAIEPLT